MSSIVTRWLSFACIKFEPSPIFIGTASKVNILTKVDPRGLVGVNFPSIPVIILDTSFTGIDDFTPGMHRTILDSTPICKLSDYQSTPDTTLRWRHNERDGVSNHQPHGCLLNRLVRHRWRKTSKLRVTGLCEGDSPVRGEFPAQRASNTENVSIWWRHHGLNNSCLIFSI